MMHGKARDISSSPLTQEQAEQLDQLVTALAPEQLSWVSGYLAGVHSAAGGVKAPLAATAAQAKLTILYGSETGNAEAVANQIGEMAAARGLQARVLDMADYKPRELRAEQLLLIVTATHGEGAPPDTAIDFYEFLHGRKAPRLESTRYAVLALGDSSYEFFCQTGRDFDARLEALGGERLIARVDCDVDYEQAVEQWAEQALAAVAAHAEPAPANVLAFAANSQRPARRYDRRNPYQAEVLENLVLNGRGSAQETRHIELSLEGSGLDYRPGDVVGVLPQNRPQVVAELMERLALDPEQLVATKAGERRLVDALRHDYEITLATPAFAAAYGRYTQAQPLLELCQDQRRAELMRYLRGRQVIDLLTEFPASELDAQTLLGMLRGLQPREYSIASSHAAYPGEVHLTVAVVRYQSHGQLRHGVASGFLAEQAAAGDTVPIYVRQNKHFRLPDDSAAPIVMIGPGTGVAPFRGFLQEREEQGGSGRNWLLFGNRYMRTDFLYQTEWQSWLKNGVLDRLDVAFSRDSAEKVYVQHRLREQGRELYRWLEEGAYVYVCGDAEYMAPDVHAALRAVVSKHRGCGNEAAEDYLKNLQREQRYQRDVY